jgi:acyl-CoA thioester hydrolase
VTEPFRHTLRVRYGECDPQGVVFNAHYLAYFDVAMTELWREVGDYAAMVDAGVDMVVAEANVRYLAGLRFDEEFEMRAHIARLGETSMSTEIEVVRNSDDGPETVAHGSLRHVFVAADGSGKRPIPDPIRAGLERYALAEDLTK